MPRRPIRNLLILAGMSLVLTGCGGAYRLPGSKIDAPPPQKPPATKKAAPEKTVAPGSVVVRNGDTLYKIALRNGVSLRGLIDANRLSPPYIIYPGQHLRLPRSNTHIVQEGENIYGIARAFNVSPGALVRQNRLIPPYHVKRGQRLTIPAGSVAQNTADANSGNRAGKVTFSGVRPAERKTSKPEGWTPPPAAKLSDPPARSRRDFLWPVRGRVVVGFGPREGGLHNDGINIRAPAGTAIRASENGVVAYAGNQLRGFGNLVLIKHKNGWMTAYAHASILFVRRGERVRRGQVIGRVGRTGSVIEPQLHFELRRNNRPVNPKPYLVRTASRDVQPSRVLPSRPAIS